jgi:hypothetical protein
LLAVVDDTVSRPRPRYGYGHQLRCHRGEANKLMQAYAAMTSCMPCRFGSLS